MLVIGKFLLTACWDGVAGLEGGTTITIYIIRRTTDERRIRTLCHVCRLKARL